MYGTRPESLAAWVSSPGEGGALILSPLQALNYNLLHFLKGPPLAASQVRRDERASAGEGKTRDDLLQRAEG